MRRTTIFLDDALERQVKQLARRRGVPFAAVVREALAEYVSAPATGAALPSIAGAFASGTPDTADRADELLWQDPHD